MLARTALLSAILPLLMLSPSALQAQDRPPMPNYLEGDPLIVVNVPGSREFLAYSKLAGRWNRFTFPEGVEAQPVQGSGVCAFVLKGDSVSELVAIDRLGNWCTTKLPAPVQVCEPIIDRNMAVCHLNGVAHAFSAETGTWDSLETANFPALSNESALVITPEFVAAFSVKTGRWATAKIAATKE